jgi:ornithine cyclodeaminase
VVVEFEPQTRIEGDLQQMPADFPVTELHRVLSGEVQGRTSREEVTVFDSVGFALEDFSTLRWLNEQSLALGIGQPLSLIPAMDDPRDLFGQLSHGRTAGATSPTDAAVAPAIKAALQGLAA